MALLKRRYSTANAGSVSMDAIASKSRRCAFRWRLLGAKTRQTSTKMEINDRDALVAPDTEYSSSYLALFVAAFSRHNCIN